MSGLDKMVSQILEEANHLAETKLVNAEKEAALILEKAKSETDAQTTEMSEKMKSEIAYQEERIRSSSERQRRKALLQGKQELIVETLDKAYETLMNLDDTSYFELLRKMLKIHVLSGDGTIFFAKADLGRMPQSFAAEIREIASEKNGTLTISEAEKKIDGGFILAYGGIEENCTFKSMLTARRDSLSDLVYKLLFV